MVASTSVVYLRTLEVDVCDVFEAPACVHGAGLKSTPLAGDLRVFGYYRLRVYVMNLSLGLWHRYLSLI